MHKRKLTTGGVIGIIVLGLLILALLIYTASRTIHFLQMTFPPDMGYVAYLALAAFDGGILGWMIFVTTAAQGPVQRGLSYIMIFVCIAGVILATVADTVITSDRNGMTKAPPYMATVGLWGSIAVIILNVVAGVAVHLASPHHTRKFELENIHDDIHAMTIRHIKASSLEIGPQLAKEQADAWVRETIQEVAGSIPGRNRAAQLPPPSSRTVESLPPTRAASRDHVVDPYQVKSQVKQKSIAKKLSLWERVRGTVNFSLPTELEPPSHQKIEAVSPDEEEEIIEPDYAEPEQEVEQLPENYLDWTDAQWKAAKEQLSPEQYSELFDTAFPPEGLKATPKKGRGGRKPKN